MAQVRGIIEGCHRAIDTNISNVGLCICSYKQAAIKDPEPVKSIKGPQEITLDHKILKNWVNNLYCRQAKMRINVNKHSTKFVLNISSTED